LSQRHAAAQPPDFFLSVKQKNPVNKESGNKESGNKESGRCAAAWRWLNSVFRSIHTYFRKSRLASSPRC
jgi:hypothetical protein